MKPPKKTNFPGIKMVIFTQILVRELTFLDLLVKEFGSVWNKARTEIRLEKDDDGRTNLEMAPEPPRGRRTKRHPETIILTQTGLPMSTS